MNTDKIYAESIANQYAPKDTSKVVALRKLDRKAKQPSEIFADKITGSWHSPYGYWYFQYADIAE